MLSLLFLFAASSGYSQVSQQWVAEFKGGSNDFPYAMAVDNSGNVYVTGSSYGSNINDIATVKFSPSGLVLWSHIYNGPANGPDVGRAIKIDPFGNIYVTGRTRTSGQNDDCIIIKYSSSGVVLWIVKYDAAGLDDNGSHIETDASGNIYITGSSTLQGINPDYITIKYSPEGVNQWVQRYDGPAGSYDAARRIILDGSGNLYVTGRSTGMNNEEDYATLKYNSTGVLQWIKRYNGTGNGYDRPEAMAIDAMSNIYVTGASKGTGTLLDGVTIKYSASGEELWVQRYDGDNLDDYSNSIGLDAAGNVYVTGSKYSNPSRYDYVTIKYNPSGLKQWVRLYNSQWGSDDASYCIAVDNEGNSYVTGWSMETIGNWGGVRFATLKYNSSGALQWVQRYTPATGTAGGEKIVLDGLGNVYVTGMGTGADSSDDFVTIKYSQNLTGVQPVSNQMPGSYSLLQNYPNPFNPSTKIRFDIPKQGLTLIKIYNAIGMEVSSIVNENLTAGTYEVQWDASGYPSGAYYYKLVSGDYSQTKKMILIK